MNTIAQLGRIAAQQMRKQAQGPLQQHDMAQSPHRDPQLSRTAPAGGPSGRDKYRNVAQPGSGGSMWGDKVVGRGGAHPDSAWANEMINGAYGAYNSSIGQPFNAKQQHQSKRLLAQDPRGKGGWAYQANPAGKSMRRTPGTSGSIGGGAEYEKQLQTSEGLRNMMNDPSYGPQAGHRLMGVK